MVAFTHISNSLFILYYITDVPLIGMISFNCATAVLYGFKSALFIDPYGYENCLNETARYHNISYNKILICDFCAHIFPVLYLLYYHNYWFHEEYISFALFLSMSMHLFWAYINCNGLNLNQVYLTNCEYKMCDKNWHKLWLFSLFGHSFTAIINILLYEFT